MTAPAVTIPSIICVLLGSERRKEKGKTITHPAAPCPSVARDPSVMSDKLSVVIKDFSGDWYVRWRAIEQAREDNTQLPY